MNAQQFIKDHGLEKAREVVEDAPEGSEYFMSDEQTLYFKTCEYGDDSNELAFWCPSEYYWISRHADKTDEYFKNLCLLSNLKHLLKSVDLVNSFGGLQGARSEAHKDCFAFEKNKPLLRAINDYESIYGEGNE